MLTDMEEITDYLRKVPKLTATIKKARVAKDRGFEGCVQLALDYFYVNFNHKLRDLIAVYPADAKTKSGKKFWSPPKRFPQVVDFDEEDDVHVAFITAMANMYAVAFGLQKLPENGRNADGTEWDTFLPEDHEWRQKKFILSMVKKCTPPEYVPSSEKIETEEDEGEEDGKEESSGVQAAMESLSAALVELNALDTTGLVGQPADFEKDLDLNFHIDINAAMANLRASSYQIKRATRHKVKMIAGKIIAAIATSTACATALVCMEILKLMQPEKEKSEFRNASCNFAINNFHMTEPQDVPVIEGKGVIIHPPNEQEYPQHPEWFDEKGELIPGAGERREEWVAVPEKWNKWDQMVIPASYSVSGLCEWFKSEHKLRVVNIMAARLKNAEDPNDKGGFKEIYKASNFAGNEALLLETAPLDMKPMMAKRALAKLFGSNGHPDVGEGMKWDHYCKHWAYLQPAQVEKRKGLEAKLMIEYIRDECGWGKNGRLAKMAKFPLVVTLETEDGKTARTPPVVMNLKSE